MANEAVIIEKSGLKPIRFTVADGAGIEKGTLLQLADPRTASASSGKDVVAGIAAAEKVASDGSTTLAVYVPGQNNIFDLKSSGAAITAGAMVSLSGANLIYASAAGDAEAGKMLGKALETADTAGEVIAVLV